MLLLMPCGSSRTEWIIVLTLFRVLSNFISDGVDSSIIIYLVRPVWRGGDIIRPLLESVEWCKPIGHRHALTRIHTAYSPALFDRLRVMS